MIPNAASQKYQKDEILGASPQKLIVLLYDGAIQRLENAKKHKDDQDPFLFTQNFTKAEAILAELTGAVKTDVNAEVGINLLKLYDFMYQTLLQAHQEKNMDKVDQVIKLLKELKESWEEAITQVSENPELAMASSEPVTAPPRRPSLSFEA